MAQPTKPITPRTQPGSPQRVGTTNPSLKPISITLDHLASCESSEYNGQKILVATPGNALKYAKILLSKNIPTTVFINLAGTDAKIHEEFDRPVLNGLKNLGNRVELGVHSLKKTAPTEVGIQDANTDYQIDVIKKLMGVAPRVGSYHGSFSLPFPGNFAGKGLKYMRGIATEGTVNTGKYNTPVEYTLNVIETATEPVTFFFHPNEIEENINGKGTFFNSLVAGVGRKYRAIQYYEAMLIKYP